MKDWLERRVYAGPLPDDVAERRQAQKEIRDSLARIDEKLNRVDDNTSWLSKFVGNMFKFGGSQAEQKYPSKKAK
jgi:hypothetical protein